MSLTSKLTKIEIPEDITLTQLILQRCEQYGNSVALVEEGTGVQYTYREFASHVRTVGAALFRRGLKKGDVILVFSTNSINYPILVHASGLIGCIITMCNPLYKQAGVVRHLLDCGAKYCVTGKAFYDTIKAAAKEYTQLKEIFVFDGSIPGCTSFSDLMEPIEGAILPEVILDPKTDVIMMPYSSGTSGLPKGVAITSYSFIASLMQITHPEINSIFEGDVCLGVIPFFHIFGMIIYVIQAIYCGAKTIVMGRFNEETLIKAIGIYKVNVIHLPPPVILLMVNHPRLTRRDITSLRTIVVGGAPLGEDLTKALMDKLDLKDIRLTYGMTECLAICFPKSDDLIPGSTGVILSNAEIKVVNVETGKLCGPHEDGELWIKGPGNMKHYHNNPQATADTMDEEGFIHSGDIGHYDEKGNFWIVDRVKELIKYNAYQVAPAELENLLLSHPDVADAAVVGMPDEKAGELPRAYIVKKANAKVTEDEIIKFVEGQVAPQKKLRGGVEFRETIPKLPSGKILRRILREDAVKLTENQKKKNTCIIW